MSFQQLIVDKAREFDLTDIGIVHADVMDEYMDRVNERIGKIPEGKTVYGWIRGLQQTHPWAKSVIVVAVTSAHYRVPQEFDGRYGKFYQHDTRVGSSKEHHALNTFDAYLKSLAIRTDRDDIMGYRWAAMAAGLGIIRRNNFFYGKDGSNYSLKAWVTDAVMEYRTVSNLATCPDNCDRCIQACPTGALSAPFTMNMARCIARLTASNKTFLANDDPLNAQIGQWIYGCDACQDVCPYNLYKRNNTEDYPGLDALSKNASPLKILAMGYDEIAEILMPQFFYLQREDLWKWKINALNALANEWKNEYTQVLHIVRNDSNELVRAKARYILEQNL